jgi:tRNA modification GTPase
MHDTPVRVALLTPPGRGALAVVGVAGAAALQTVAKLFHPRGGAPLASRPDGTIAFGRWADAERGEELVVVQRSPESLEVHCHGGVAASAAVIRSLEAAGAVRQPWPEWLAAGGAAEIEFEAREALAQASGPKAARILARQLAGELGREIDRIAALRAAGRQAEADAATSRLLRASRVGLRLTKPWRVVIAGPVNAGKSSLVNALAGHARSIVSAEPGTTRDLLETRIVLDGWEIDLVDTAGLRGEDLAAASPTERAGIVRAIAATGEADLIVRLSRTGCQPVSFDHPRELHVLSQCDRSPADAACPPGVIRTSAVTGEGIPELATAIVRRLVPEEHGDPTLLAGAVPFTQRQVDRLLRKRICPIRPLR